MRTGIVIWVVLSLLSLYSLYIYSTILSLSATLFVFIYAVSLLLTKTYAIKSVKYFFISLSFILVGVSSYYLARGYFAYSSFAMGMFLAVLVLIPFKALPFVEGWTRGKAKFRYRNVGFHHWFAGSLIIPFFVLFLPWLARYSLFSWIEMFLEPERMHFFLGFGLFWFTSQIPEILLSRAAFPVAFQADC